MYKIISNGETIGVCDEVRYIRNHKGTFVQCQHKFAEGLAIGGQAYNLPSHTEIVVDGKARPEAKEIKVDAGEYLFSQNKAVADLNKAMDDVVTAMLGG